MHHTIHKNSISSDKIWHAKCDGALDIRKMEDTNVAFLVNKDGKF